MERQPYYVRWDRADGAERQPYYAWWGMADGVERRAYCVERQAYYVRWGRAVGMAGEQRRAQRGEGPCQPCSGLAEEQNEVELGCASRYGRRAHLGLDRDFIWHCVNCLLHAIRVCLLLRIHQIRLFRDHHALHPALRLRWGDGL